MGCDGTDAAYVPWAAWHPDLPGPVRLQVVLAGVLFSLSALACLLLPRILSLPAIAIAVFVAIIAIGWWQFRSPQSFLAQGSVIVEDAKLRQTDRWQFITSRQSASSQFDCAGETWPIFADSSQALRENMALNWKDGTGRFTFRLPPDGKLAFVSRTIHPQSAKSPVIASANTQSPMADIARSLYMRDHEQQIIEPGGNWTTTDASPTWAAVHLIK